MRKKLLYSKNNLIIESPPNKFHPIRYIYFYEKFLHEDFYKIKEFKIDLLCRDNQVKKLFQFVKHIIKKKNYIFLSNLEEILFHEQVKNFNDSFCDSFSCDPKYLAFEYKKIVKNKIISFYHTMHHAKYFYYQAKENIKYYEEENFYTSFWIYDLKTKRKLFNIKFPIEESLYATPKKFKFLLLEKIKYLNNNFFIRLKDNARLGCQNGEIKLFSNIGQFIKELEILKILLKKDANLDTHLDNHLEYESIEDSLKIEQKEINKFFKNIIETCLFEEFYDISDTDFIYLVVTNDHIEILKLLINSNFNINSQDLQGGTALHYACQMANEEMVEIILNHGADVNIINNNFYTALHYASKNININIVQILLKHGAKVNIQNNLGNTALHYAAIKGNEAIIQILLDFGADTQRENNKQHIAAYYAMIENHDDELINLLQLPTVNIYKNQAIEPSLIYYDSVSTTDNIVN